MNTTKHNAAGSMLEVPGKGTVFFGEKVNPLRDEKEKYVKMVTFEMGENQQFTFNFSPDGTRRSMLSGPKEMQEGDLRGVDVKKEPMDVNIHFDKNGGVERIRFPSQRFEVQLCDGYDLYIFSDYVARVSGPAEDPDIRVSKLIIADGKPMEAGEINEENSGSRYHEHMDEARNAVDSFHSFSPNITFPDTWKDAPEGSLPRTWHAAMEKADSLHELQEVVRALKPEQD